MLNTQHWRFERKGGTAHPSYPEPAYRTQYSIPLGNQSRACGVPKWCVINYHSEFVNLTNNPEHHFTASICKFNTIAQVAIFLGVFCSVVMDLSHNDGDFIMGLINIILFLAFSGPGGEITPKHEDIITQMLQNIQQALSKFDLNNHTTTYAVCPACHCTYKPWYKKGSLVSIYDEMCCNWPTPESGLCREPLLHKRDGSPKPIKTFIYHHFHDFVSNLLSCQDLEEAMGKACDDLKSDLDNPPPPPPPPRVCERCMAGRVFKDIQGTHTRSSLHWQTWWGPLWVHFQCWFLRYWRDVDSRGKNILQPHIYGVSQPSLWNLLSIGEHVHGWHHSWPQRAKPHRTQSLSKTCNQQSCNVMENGCSL